MGWQWDQQYILMRDGEGCHGRLVEFMVGGVTRTCRCLFCCWENNQKLFVLFISSVQHCLFITSLRFGCTFYHMCVPLFPNHPFEPCVRGCAEWKTALRCSLSTPLSAFHFCPPQSVCCAPPPARSLPTVGAGPVRASRCPCISCAEWRPGPWTGQGPASSASAPAAWYQTSWRTCSCRSAAGQSGQDQPSGKPGRTGGNRGEKNVRVMVWAIFQSLWFDVVNNFQIW